MREVAPARGPVGSNGTQVFYDSAAVPHGKISRSNKNTLQTHPRSPKADPSGDNQTGVCHLIPSLRAGALSSHTNPTSHCRFQAAPSASWNFSPSGQPGKRPLNTHKRTRNNQATGTAGSWPGSLPRGAHTAPLEASLFILPWGL